MNAPLPESVVVTVRALAESLRARERRWFELSALLDPLVGRLTVEEMASVLEATGVDLGPAVSVSADVTAWLDTPAVPRPAGRTQHHGGTMGARVRRKT